MRLPRKRTLAVLGATLTLAVAVSAVAKPDAPARLKADTTFAGDGHARFNFCDYESGECYEYGSAVATDSQGRTVVAEVVAPGYEEVIGVLRVLPNGELDQSFGNGGSTLLPGERSRTIAVDSQDRILIDADGLTRLNSDGSIDQSFGEDGTAQGPSGAIAIDSSGRILVAGDPPGRYGVSVHRYLPDGTPDPAFDGSGMVYSGFGPSGAGSVQAIALGRQGGVYAVGSIACGAGYEKGLIARFKPDGGLDKSFGRNGKLTTRGCSDPHGYRSAAVDSHGRIIAAGPGVNGTGGGLVDRYRPDGRPDTTFSGDGSVHSGGYGGDGVVVDSRDRIATIESESVDVFGTGGRLVARAHIGPNGDGYEQLVAITIDDSGRVVTAGDNDEDIAVSRYKALAP